MRAALLAGVATGLVTLTACADAPDAPPPADAPTEPVALGEVTTPADSGAVAPRLSVGPDGTVVLSWTEPDGEGHAVRYATWTGAGWSEAETADTGVEWFVNWADTPGVTPLADGFLAHALVMHPDGESPYAYDVAVRQAGADRVWGAADLLHTDGVAAEHGFVSVVPRAGGGADVVWLDGRNTGGHHDGGPMTLRAVTIGPDGARRDEAELDARVCDCCPTAAVATDAGLVVAYRDRSEAEVRDVAVVRRVDGRWTAPTVPHADGWQIDGCPVNGPALAARGDRVALAWFTAAPEPTVRLAVSDDGGATWGEPVQIDGGRPLGRVGMAMTDSGDVLVGWLETADEATAAIRLRRVTSGAARDASTVAKVNAGRASGVPHVVALGDRALVAWTGGGTVRTAVVAP